MTKSATQMPDLQELPDAKLEKRSRRNHSTEYKLRIIAQADACSHGELGALLRREKLYSSQVQAWRPSQRRYAVTGGEDMKKTSAERQAAYRRNRPVTGVIGERRVNMWVTTEVSMGLERLARRNGVTQRAMLEALITAADDEVFSKLVDDAAVCEYLGVTQ